MELRRETKSWHSIHWVKPFYPPPPSPPVSWPALHYKPSYAKTGDFAECAEQVCGTHGKHSHIFFFFFLSPKHRQLIRKGCYALSQKSNFNLPLTSKILRCSEHLFFFQLHAYQIRSRAVLPLSRSPAPGEVRGGGFGAGVGLVRLFGGCRVVPHPIAAPRRSLRSLHISKRSV